MISWFSRRDERKEGRRPSRTSHQPGVAVGPAIFRPKRVHDIREDLRRAVGQVADEDVQFIDAPRIADAHDSARREAHPGRLEHDAPLVLVADGSRDTRDLYGLVLTTAGFQVIEAEDGLSAIALARAAAPDAIVIDLDLPQMSGLDAIKLLRAEAGTSRTPILAFTAHGEAAAAAAIRCGADALCRKPCFPEAFLEALRSILPAAVELKGVRR